MPTGLLTTTLGQAAIATDLAGGADLVLTHVAFGDAGSVPYTPNPAQTALVNEKYRATISSVAVIAGAIVIDAIIPADTPDGSGRPSHSFAVAEAGIFSAAGTLIAVAQMSNGYKPAPGTGQASIATFRFKLAVSNPSAITVVIDPQAQISVGRHVRPFWMTVDGVLNAPPASPATGATYLIGSAPTGAWAGFANRIAQWVGVWALSTVPTGHQVVDQSANRWIGNRWLERTAGGWEPGLSTLVQRQPGNYVTAAGTANAITIAPDPAFAALVVGAPIRIMIAAANTGPATLNVNGLGAAPIVTRSGQALAADDLPAGAIMTVIWSGAAFILTGLARSETVAALALTYYVAPTGSDSNPGTVGAPFLTLQRAVDVGSRVRTIAGSAVNINVSNGTYAPFTANVRDTTFNIVGNTATPASCVIANTVAGSPCASFLGSRATLRGFKLTGIGPGVSAAEQANIKVGNLEFGVDGAQATSGYSVSASGASLFRLIGPVRQLAQNLGAVFVSGAGSTVDLGAQTVTIDALNAILSPGVPGPVAWANGGFINAAGAAFAGAGPNYAKRYQSDSGSGNIWTNGAGVNFIPGTVAGTGTYA